MSATTCRLSIRLDPKVESVITRAVCVLTQAELDAALTLVTDRLLRSGRLLEFQTENGKTTAQLRPYAELALLEASDIGCQTCHDTEVRTRRIEQVLNLSGY